MEKVKDLVRKLYVRGFSIFPPRCQTPLFITVRLLFVRVYLKSPQRCSILLKSTSAALLILAIHPVLQRIRALQLLLFSEFSSTFDLSDTP